MNIAMRCSQEQYDAIKDRLGDFMTDSVTSFIMYPYLVSCDEHITNVDRIDGTFTHLNVEKWIEEWSENDFLNYCGIETEKIFKGSELQYKSSMDIEWQKFPDSWDIRIKPDYSKEIAELERQIEILKNK